MPAPSHFASQRRVPLPGSGKHPIRTADSAPRPASCPPSEQLTVSVIIRASQPLDPQNIGGPHARLSRAQYAERHGSHPESVRLVKAFANEFGLTAKDTGDSARRTLQMTGTVSAMEKAFGVSLSQQEINGETCRVREGEIQLPEELSGHIVAVLGLDNRPQAKPHFRIAKPHASNISYSPVQVAQLYGFPPGATAKGQTIGIVELGGGYREADLTAYFKTLGLPNPAVKAIQVDEGKNAPGTADGADAEVMLDIEVCAAVASGANIAVYFAPNTDQGFIDAITTAVHDSINGPSVISISWGGPESSWTSQAMTALDAACQAAAVLGVTIVVACGDNGSTDGVAGSANHVDFPASSPHVLACGGTTLKGNGSRVDSEVVWNETAIGEGATGGGVSAVFPLPSWQSVAKVPAPATQAGGRGVPDVAGDADPSTGYTVRVDGQTMVIGGTSAVAPLWAGLIALANAQNSSSAGFANPALYSSAASRAFRDITEGTNGGFSAGPGWDACTGLGSPIGTLVIWALGAPKTP